MQLQVSITNPKHPGERKGLVTGDGTGIGQVFRMALREDHTRDV